MSDEVEGVLRIAAAGVWFVGATAAATGAWAVAAAMALFGASCLALASVMALWRQSPPTGGKP